MMALGKHEQSVQTAMLWTSSVFSTTVILGEVSGRSYPSSRKADSASANRRFLYSGSTQAWARILAPSFGERESILSAIVKMSSNVQTPFSINSACIAAARKE